MFLKKILLTVFIASTILLTVKNDVPVFSASCGQLLGVYYGQEGFNIGSLNKLENWQQKKNAVVNLYTDFNVANQDDLFKTQLPNLWNNKNIPLIAWSPFTAGTTPKDIEVQIARGDYNVYLKNWGARLNTFLAGNDGKFGTVDDRRAYIRLGSEMNGDWHPWSASSGKNQPSDFQNMWKRVYNMVNTGLDKNHLQWIWTVNVTDEGTTSTGGLYKAEQYYPGDQYVDWMGIDGYNFGISGYQTLWQSPNQVYDGMIGRLNKLSPAKPIAINELASTTNNRGTAAKEQWITDTYKYFNTKNIKMAVWFNQDKETDWAIFGAKNGTEAYQNLQASKAYRLAVSQPNYISSDSNNPKLLTDDQFKGNICATPTPVIKANTSSPVIAFDSPAVSNPNTSPAVKSPNTNNTTVGGKLTLYGKTIRTGVSRRI